MSEIRRMAIDLSRNMREPRTIAALGRLRVRVLAPPDDPAISQSGKGLVHRAALAVDATAVRLLHPFTPTYGPEFPRDWADHPWAHRCIEMHGFHALGSQLSVIPYQIGTIFFPLSRTFVAKLLSGERTEEDLLMFLEKNRNAGPSVLVTGESDCE